MRVVGPEGWFYDLAVHYPALGMGFDLAPGEHDLGAVRPTFRVTTVHFSPPGELKPYLEQLDTCLTSDETAEAWAEKRMRVLQPWQGFGKKLETFDTR